MSIPEEPRASLTASPSIVRRAATWFNQHPRATLSALLTGPLGWIAIIYLGSLFILVLHAFWARDAFTGKVEPFNWTLDAFGQVLSNSVYLVIGLRTIGIAILVTLIDILLALPVAYYMARIASPKQRALLLVAITMPLWASYLVKVYAWRTILQSNGLLGWLLSPFGLEGPGLSEISNSVIVFSYLWLPYMILPIYAGLERIPNSLFEASADLGGRGWMTFRRVIFPQLLPALVAGSIFTFSLTLGDYIVPDLVSDAKFIGNVIYDNSALGSFPVAAVYSLLPIIVMTVYLVLARRLGAFESL